MTMRLPSLLMGGVLLLLGCGSDFDPDYQLKKARVLALQADPPQPQFGTTTTLRALLYLPQDETPSYHWSWCPAPTVAESGFACPIDQAGFETFLGVGAGQAPSLDLGTGETAVLTNVFAPEMLAALCSGQATGASASVGFWACASGGFPITVRMEFQTPSMALTDPNHWLPAVFKVFLPTDATQPSNQNPLLGTLATIAPLPGQPLDDTASVTLRRNLEYKLRLAMETTVSETFRGWTRDSQGGYSTDASGNHVIGDVREIISLKWYVEGGDLGNDNGDGGSDTGYNPYAAIPQPITNATDNFWKTPKLKDYGNDRARIIVVARDDRGGVGWTSAAVTLEAQP
jgi:hypothetical protein